MTFAPMRLPPAPPMAGGGLFDPENRRDTLLAIGAGFLSGHNFADGAGAVAQNLYGRSQQLRQEQRQTREFGGPDNAFEIVTDPRTGDRTVAEVPQFAEYLKDRRVKPKDVADINGRAMFALMRLPKEQRAAVYADMRAHPDRYGVDPDTMPETYDENYAAVTSGMGMTVSQAMTRDQASSNAADLRTYRGQVHEDRQERTGIYRARSEATTAQGAARLGIARQREGRVARGGGGGRKVGSRPKLNPKNLDLGYLTQ